MITEVKWLAHPTLWKHFRGLDLLNPASGACTWTYALKESECGRWAGSQGGKMCWRAVSLLFGGWGGEHSEPVLYCAPILATRFLYLVWLPLVYIREDLCLSLCAETIFKSLWHLEQVVFNLGSVLFFFMALLNWFNFIIQVESPLVSLYSGETQSLMERRSVIPRYVYRHAKWFIN